MKDGPKRWRDDPEVPEALRADLSAEAESLASHDLGAMQQALQAKIAAGASAGVGAASVVPYLIGALVLGGAATWWAATGGPEPEQVASVERGASAARGDANARSAGSEGDIDEDGANGITDERASTVTRGGADGVTDARGAHAAEERAANATADKSGTSATRSSANAAAEGGARGAIAKSDADGLIEARAGHATKNGADGAPIQGGANAAAEGGSHGASAKDGAHGASTNGAPPASDLAAQLDAYERAQRLLGDGDAAAAIDAFAAYLAAYPDGRLRTEARLGQLHALFAAERFTQAAATAEGLRGGALAAHRRRDVERVLGESRAMLGACDAADVALKRAGTSGEERARIIARCRGSSKE
ncbi:MAG: hypothetical protein RIT81_24555 [Deltaproteobacteria bacterium]